MNQQNKATFHEKARGNSGNCRGRCACMRRRTCGRSAAITAARQGVKTMVIEKEDCLGGIATAGMMSHWGGRSSSRVMQEIFRRTREKGEIVDWKEEIKAANARARTTRSRTTHRKSYSTKWQKKRALKSCFIQAFAA